ncbi:uncharacterized protein [Ptychodera flava]|uniref:uncharacterized protein n=1 Tax=Ptychodera flava TaxID=63121 RepID=UPI00396A53FD
MGKRTQEGYYECEEVNKSYARFAAFFKEGTEPCDGLEVAIELNSQHLIQHLQKFKERLEMSRHQPVDQSVVATLEQTIQKVNRAFNQCQQCLKRKAEQTINEDSEKLERLCYEAHCGVNRVTNLKEGSLGMLLNFLSILGLYRFKSSVQTGRFAELYEPWLITDEMRQIAAKVNLPLNYKLLQQGEVDELDSFFIERDGRISDSVRHFDGEDGYRFERQPKSSQMEQRPALHIFKLDTEIEYKFALEAMRLILFKLDQVLQSQRVSKDCLPRILNIDSSAVLEHISCDVIQVPVEITERIRHILLSKQEILSLLGIRLFLVTDMEEELTAEALEEQFEIHGNIVSGINTSHSSLLLRGLLLYNNISQSRVGSYWDLCFLDLEHTYVKDERQTQMEMLKIQLNTAQKGKCLLEKQYKERLKELDKAGKEVKHLEDELQNTMEDREKVAMQLKKARHEAEVLKSRLDEVKEGKSVSDKQYEERLEELGKAEKVATDKALEIASLKKKIQDLEAQLAESSDLVTKMLAQQSDAETKLAESRVLVIEMQAKLSDAENKALEIDTLRDKLDRAEKELAQLKDQLGIAVKEKKQIQEELDRERKVKRLPQAAAYTEPQPIGDERYIGEKEDLGFDGGECLHNDAGGE